ncbi:hypothetical protein CMI38_03005 [Candidatus Pacearchaeota archaeon]|jgi:hypothetical protein|nr:hypothetical protein [Candidatus Pacearchaeota archaeon]|tara:strand:+ start:778 stop:999 length:222 start_codon:yes stop_codon:yes gene_type:complete
MNYHQNYRRDLNQEWDNFLTSIFGPPPENSAIKDEQDLRDLDERLRSTIEPKAIKWNKVRAESQVEARFHYLD